jgi:pyridoxal 5'-phosphate synthase pdxT subunit
MEQLDGIVLPGGESTAMGLIGTNSIVHNGKNILEALQDFTSQKPTWGTCAGMILLAEQCVGASAVIENGQALIGGMDILVCRNYFGSQVSSFEMATPPPPPFLGDDKDDNNNDAANHAPYPGVFIRAPAILSAGPDVEILGRVVATPCRQAAVVLTELNKKIINGEEVVQPGIVGASDKKSSQEINFRGAVKEHSSYSSSVDENKVTRTNQIRLELPGAADGSTAREVICAVKKNNLLCTAFHPELTNDYRWHEYFANMVRRAKSA